jgi:hypothetical protein
LSTLSPSPPKPVRKSESEFNEWLFDLNPERRL